MARNKLSEEKRSEVVAVYTSTGSSMIKVAEQFGVSSAEVRKVLKSANAVRPRGRVSREVSEEQKEKIIDLYKNGNKVTKEISAELKISTTKIYAVLKKSGIEVKRGRRSKK